MHTRAALPIVCVAIAAIAPAAVADIAPANAVYWTNTETAFEARVRLDAGNSQTWKSAFWQGSTLLSTSGNAQNVFLDGASNPFNFEYNADTGLATLNVAGRSTTSTIHLADGKSLAGVRFALRSESGVGTTLLSNVIATINNADPAIALPDLSTGLTTNTYQAGEELFFSAAATSFGVTGDLAFDWGAGNISGDRFKLSLYVMMGNALPSAPTLAVLAPLALTTRRRR